jgi:hypothetical protein
MILKRRAQQAWIAARSMMRAALDDCGAKATLSLDPGPGGKGITLFRFRSWDVAPVARRIAVVLALALPTAWVITAAAVSAPAASACDASSHCVTQAQNKNTNLNFGVYGELNAHCLYQPDNGNRVTNELWDTDSSASNWVEAGITGGRDYNGYYRDKNWFWADKRPGYSYSEHVVNATANTDTSYPAEITYHGSNEWYVYGKNSFVQYGTSTNNGMQGIHVIGGTEFWGSATSGIRDQGDVYNLERESSTGQWYSWGNNGANVELGPGNYIPGNFSNSHESWTGPC